MFSQSAVSLLLPVLVGLIGFTRLLWQRDAVTGPLARRHAKAEVIRVQMEGGEHVSMEIVNEVCIILTSSSRNNVPPLNLYRNGTVFEYNQ